MQSIPSQNTLNQGQLAEKALVQVASLCSQTLGFSIQLNSTNTSFSTKSDPAQSPIGVIAIEGKIEDELINLRMELLNASSNMRASLAAIFEKLSHLGPKVSLLAPQELNDGQTSYAVGLTIKAQPLTATRTNTFVAELRSVDKLATEIKEELPSIDDESQAKEKFKELNDVLEPVPLLGADQAAPDSMGEWSESCIDYLEAGCNLAISCKWPAVIDYALACIASKCMPQGILLGNFTKHAINANTLIALTSKAPGPIVVQSIKLSLASNPYSIGSEMQSLLAAISDSSKPVVFTGSYDQLQSVFAGGQGDQPDPLRPVVKTVPAVSLNKLLQFSVHRGTLEIGGVARHELEILQKRVKKQLKGIPEDKAKSILPAIVKSTLNRWLKNHAAVSQAENLFSETLASTNKTLSGLTALSIHCRNPDVQKNFSATLSDPDLLSHFQRELLAQDRALNELCNRLRTEALSRPLDQPLRFCTQGVPGVGKSESAVILAQLLNIPYINIDAASMPDYHTAASQLLGSGRGLVMSHKAGKLEQVGKIETGAVVEVSDLDHANANVRAALADLFLQVMDTGNAQSAIGSNFSCTNLIFAFTLNLPNGMDEGVHKSIGFASSSDPEEIKSRVNEEIKNMLSSAFVSRVGSPILFSSLTDNAVGEIINRVIQRAASTALARLGFPSINIAVDAMTGIRINQQLPANTRTMGARLLNETGRSLAVNAVSEWVQQYPLEKKSNLLIAANAKGQINITPVN
ncbi:MAG: AAA domain-containing protein [Pseudomonadales bacterium]|nr:AAA domain-containing protein [Pseudomonadales bacterium]